MGGGASNQKQTLISDGLLGPEAAEGFYYQVYGVVPDRSEMWRERRCSKYGAQLMRQDTPYVHMYAVKPGGGREVTDNR